MIFVCIVGVVVTFSVSALAWYNDKQYKMVTHELNKNEIVLKNDAAELEKNREELHKKQAMQMTELATKKAELVRDNQISLERLAEAQKIEDAARNKVAVLQKQINQLQGALHHARQRAQRLAKKVENRL